MKKYVGANYWEWEDTLYPETKFIEAVKLFCIKGYQPFIKRKTITKEEREAIRGLREMLDLIEAHAQEAKED